ncbi:protein DENND6B isoform X3 [Ascaphus truei]|uniref:protein DENND6B isoform X3 n=1 Tax=Ascaphus truei TaxID=8439 RepID=UPI003F591420
MELGSGGMEAPGSPPGGVGGSPGSRRPWDIFSAWLQCVCVVTFDLELGQAMELVYPQDIRITEKEKTSICYLSFPDSYSGRLGDTQFTFRMRRSVGQRSCQFQEDEKYNREAPVTLQVRIPSRSNLTEGNAIEDPHQEDPLDHPWHITGIHELDLFRSLQSVLMNLQLLWELVLLGEPLVVMAPSPTISSEIVLALTGCISPLKFYSDFRPYFTIHDSEFKEYTTRTQAPPSLLLGVTNPFFIKTLQHWPHILRVGEPRMSGDLPKQIKLKKMTKLKILDTKAGMYTSYKPYLHKDKTVMKQLLKGLQKTLPSSTLSSILRRHLFELTQSFILPVERYMGSLMPHYSSITAWKNPPQVRPFQQEELMKTLEHTGPQLGSGIKGDWMGLYRRFLKSPHFEGWYRQKQREMSQRLETQHLQVICEANIAEWIKNKSEVEIVDLVLKLRDKLLRAHRQHLPVSATSLQRLGCHIDAVICSLPEDLQSILHPN